MNRRTFILSALATAFSAPAAAHWRYDPACCSDADCQPVPDGYIHETGDIIVVRVPAGAHKMWPIEKRATFYAEITRAELRQPLDGRWHVCISPGGALLCVYPPERSF